MVLVDTSAWIDFFRASTRLSASVDRLLGDDEAALCGPVVTELRRGLRNKTDRARVLPLLAGCHLLAQPENLWEEAGELGFFLGRKGIIAKSVDLLIAVYALAHAVPLLTADADFHAMRRAGLSIRLST